MPDLLDDHLLLHVESLRRETRTEDVPGYRPPGARIRGGLDAYEDVFSSLV